VPDSEPEPSSLPTDPTGVPGELTQPGQQGPSARRTISPEDQVAITMELLDASLSMTEANELLFKYATNPSDPARRFIAIRLLKAAGDDGLNPLLELIRAESSSWQTQLIELVLQFQVTECQASQIGGLPIPPGLEPKIREWASNLKPSDGVVRDSGFEGYSIAQIGAAIWDQSKSPEHRCIWSLPVLAKQIPRDDEERCQRMLLGWMTSVDGGKRAAAWRIYLGIFEKKLDEICKHFISWELSRQSRTYLVEALTYINRPLSLAAWVMLAYEGLHQFREMGASIVNALYQLPHFVVDENGQKVWLEVPARRERTGATLAAEGPEDETTLVWRLLSAATDEEKISVFAAMRRTPDCVGLLTEKFCSLPLPENQRLILLEAIAALETPLTIDQFLAVSTRAIWGMKGQANRVAAALTAMPYVLDGLPGTLDASPKSPGKKAGRAGPTAPISRSQPPRPRGSQAPVVRSSARPPKPPVCVPAPPEPPFATTPITDSVPPPPEPPAETTPISDSEHPSALNELIHAAAARFRSPAPPAPPADLDED